MYKFALSGFFSVNKCTLKCLSLSEMCMLNSNDFLFEVESVDVGFRMQLYFLHFKIDCY